MLLVRFLILYYSVLQSMSIAEFNYLSRIYRNTINFSLMSKFNLFNFYLLPNVMSLFVNINLNNMSHFFDLRIFKSYYLILYLTGFKPYLNGFSSIYKKSKKLFNVDVMLFLSNNKAYYLTMKFSKKFFFKLKGAFFFENKFKFFSNVFFFSISNINL